MLKVIKAAAEALIDFYLYPLPHFQEEKDPQTYLAYRAFRIRGFRGLEDVALSFSRNDLVLLLGLNESGKTSILKAIDAFDASNDPTTGLKQFFTSMRNKQDIDCSTPCIISADIAINGKLNFNVFKKVLKAAGFADSVKNEVEAVLDDLNKQGAVSISRVVPFSNGNPGRSYYKFDQQFPLHSEKLSSILANEIVRRCPFIIYFEDFQDAIPDKIYTQPRNPAYNNSWYDIIDGLFYNTDAGYTIKKYEKYFSSANLREDDARSVLKRVNKTLQKTFTEKWKNLSGVQEIAEAELTYSSAKKFFEIKVTERDGTTFSVHERSKGAIWYLAFLMKTEFRRKKLRDGSGKPVYLIDEPASNLHSTAQQKMVEDFSTLVDDTTLIYTTHSQYLISPSNIKSTYVVGRENGIVSCTRWGDYIRGKDAKTSYYQPLYDCLQIVPNNLSIPWERAVITEGPSDALTLEFMERVLDQEATHAFYPGTTAHDLGTLISLNLGWRAQFRVMLDSDNDGEKAAKKYKQNYGLIDNHIVLLPGKDTEIEDMFTMEEKIALYKLCFNTEISGVSKDEFLATVRSLRSKPETNNSKAAALISESTKNSFAILFEKLKAPMPVEP